MLQAHFDLRDPEKRAPEQGFPPIIACRHQPSSHMRPQLEKLARRILPSRGTPHQPRISPDPPCSPYQQGGGNSRWGKQRVPGENRSFFVALGVTVSRKIRSGGNIDHRSGSLANASLPICSLQPGISLREYKGNPSQIRRRCRFECISLREYKGNPTKIRRRRRF